MNRFLLGAVGGLSIVASASAADLAARPYTKVPAPVAATMYNWSGFYIGVNAGGGWSSKCWDVSNAFGFPVDLSEGCHDATGAVVGGQAGYRWQSAAFVFGLEAQGNWANLRGSNRSLAFPDTIANRSTIDALGLFTGQVGYSWNNALWYVKGGAAVTRDRYEGLATDVFGQPAIAIGTVFDSATETRWGGVVGTGLEFGFAPDWSFAVEYNHLFMGSRDVALLSTGATDPAGRAERIRQDVDMVTARVNYRFGGPSVARY